MSSANFSPEDNDIVTCELGSDGVFAPVKKLPALPQMPPQMGEFLIGFGQGMDLVEAIAHRLSDFEDQFLDEDNTDEEWVDD